MHRPNTHSVEAAPDVAVDELFTRREREVLAGLAFGLSNRNIARRLYLTEKSVKNRVTSILRKLRLKNRAQAACWALEHGLDGKAIFLLEESARKGGF